MVNQEAFDKAGKTLTAGCKGFFGCIFFAFALGLFALIVYGVLS